MIYTLTLNPALDYDIYLDNLEKDKLNLSKKINLRAGGKGINVSIMLKNLGIENKAIGLCAGFVGDFLKQQLDEMNIANMFFNTNGITRINVKINDRESETEIAGLSDKIKEEYLEDLFSFLSKLKEDDILVLSGSIPKGVENNVYYKIAKNIKSKTFLDTRGNLILDNVYNNILVKPNIKELEEMFSDKIDTEEKIIKYAKKIIEKGVKNVIVSMGSKGAMLINENICLKASIPKGEYINSIGSGDSMVAGFIYSYINNFDDINKLKYAIACGSATAYSYGIANIDLVNKLLEDIEIMEV